MIECIIKSIIFEKVGDLWDNLFYDKRICLDLFPNLAPLLRYCNYNVRYLSSKDSGHSI